MWNKLVNVIDIRLNYSNYFSRKPLYIGLNFQVGVVTKLKEIAVSSNNETWTKNSANVSAWPI